MGILADACDPFGYREHRNLEELVSCASRHNVFTAVAIGGFKDAFEPLGDKAEAPILERADDEHLEKTARIFPACQQKLMVPRHTEGLWPTL